MATKKTSGSSKGKSSAKTNANRVVKAVNKYDTSKSVKDNSDAIKGVVSATATSAKRSSNKKQKGLYIALTVIIIIAVIALAIYGYYHGWFDAILGNRDPLDYNSATYDPVAIKSEQLSIHFLQLKNGANGDCIYIKAGDTDILIDAGSKESSAQSIEEYVNRYCTDGKLEYVIATHADEDHIAGFVGSAKVKGIFDRYECETIIRFARSSKLLTTEKGNPTLYSNFLDACKAEEGNGATYVTALDCYNNVNGGQRVYQLADGITMEVLYQEYYENTTSNENDYSVCLLFKQQYVDEEGKAQVNNYLLLGDLEESGEKSLVNKNPDLPEVVLYKGGHHGSKTSGNDVLLSKIKPQIVCICCVAGSVEYTQNLDNTFPTQAFIDRIAQYTESVYATDMANVQLDKTTGRYKNTSYGTLNGDIVFACTDGKVTMYFSNNDTKLKDTEWFAANRTCPDAWKKQSA